MLNLEETLFFYIPYNIQRDLYLKGFLYVISAIVFLDLLRSQVSEVNLLQLIPGFYILLVFLCFIILMLLSTYFFSSPFRLDNQEKFGGKTFLRIQKQIEINSRFFFLLSYLFTSFNTIIPIALDAFDSYSEKTLTNLWSFLEVVSLESTLVIILITLSQIPTFFGRIFFTEIDLLDLIGYWKNLSLIVFLAAGWLTPTIDGYTQICFSIAGISLYLTIVNLLEKRLSIKFSSTSTLNF